MSAQQHKQLIMNLLVQALCMLPASLVVVLLLMGRVQAQLGIVEERAVTERGAATARLSADAPLVVASLVNLDAEQHSSVQYRRWLESELDHLIRALDDLGLEDRSLLVELCNPPGGHELAGAQRGHMRLFHDANLRLELHATWERIAARLGGRRELWGVSLLSEPATSRDEEGRRAWHSLATQLARTLDRRLPERRIVVEPLDGALSELDPRRFPSIDGVRYLVWGLVPGARLQDAASKHAGSHDGLLRGMDFGTFFETVERRRRHDGRPVLLTGRRPLLAGDALGGQALRLAMQRKHGVGAPAQALVGLPMNHPSSVRLAAIDVADEVAIEGGAPLHEAWRPRLATPRRVLPAPDAQPVDDVDLPFAGAGAWGPDGDPLSDNRSHENGGADGNGGRDAAVRGLGQLDATAVAARRFGVRALGAIPGLTRNPFTVLVRWRPDEPELYRSQVRSMVGDGAHLTLMEEEHVELLALRVPVHVAMERLAPYVADVEPNLRLELCQGHTTPTRVPRDGWFMFQPSLQAHADRPGMTVDLQDFPVEWNADINAPQGWHHRTDASLVRIAVLDTGVYRHVDFYGVDNSPASQGLVLDSRPPDLAVSNLWHNASEVVDLNDNDGNGKADDLYGWDFVDNDNDPYVGNSAVNSLAQSHGTGVAGVAGAMSDNGIANPPPGQEYGRGIAGVAWRCQIVPLRMFDDINGVGVSDVSIAIDALDYCRRSGFEVLNCSWTLNTSVPNQVNGLHDAIQALALTNGGKGQLVVAAAGNTRTNLTPSGAVRSYPASFDLANIISVGATDALDRPWSSGLGAGENGAGTNYGTGFVDIYAPGEKVISLAPGVADSGVYAGRVGTYTGTSFAAPHVAGAAALVWAANPAWDHVQVKSRLVSTRRMKHYAQPLLPDEPEFGTDVGVLDLGAALAPSDATDPAPVVEIVEPPLDAGQSYTTRIAGQPVLFRMSAIDRLTNNGPIALIPESDLYWRGSVTGGFLSQGTAQFSTATLAPGLQSVVAHALEYQGNGRLVTATRVMRIVLAPVPATPGTPVAVPSGGAVQVSWADNSNNETSFELQRQRLVSGSWTSTVALSAPMNATSIIDTAGTGTYRYRVRARNGPQTSGWSSWSTN